MQGKAQIAQLIHEAVENQGMIQFAQANVSEPRIFIPRYLTGNTVQGLSPATQSYEAHNINQMTWVRLI